MIEREKQYFELYSKTREFADEVSEALKIITNELDDSSYVACSGGKDSLALLHLCQSSEPSVSVFHFDAGKFLIPSWVERDIQSCMRKAAPRAKIFTYSFQIGTKEASRSQSTTHSWYKAYYSTLVQFMREQRKVKAFVGLRMEESARRRSITRMESNREIYPLKGWSWRTTWAYIVSSGLPYPRVYDIYAGLLGYDKARLVTFFDAEFDKLGSTNIDNVLMWRDKHLE